jgi:FkbM family methyltransferase
MYSQNNEDDFFLTYFSQLENGTLLEIGAYDSTLFSNSKALIEKNWNAYLVDASPFCMTKLFDSYKENDKVHLIQSLVMTEKSNDLIGFHEYPFSAVSSIFKDHTKKYYSDKEDFNKNSKEIFVTSIELNDLIKFVISKSGNIDFLSIDVEGFSADLALNVDLNVIKPKCICIEHDFKENMLVQKFNHDYNVSLHNGENIVFTIK